MTLSFVVVIKVLLSKNIFQIILFICPMLLFTWMIILWKYIIIVEPWKVTLVDTGDKTQTGGRLKRVFKYLENERYFVLLMVMVLVMLILLA